MPIHLHPFCKQAVFPPLKIQGQTFGYSSSHPAYTFFFFSFLFFSPPEATRRKGFLALHSKTETISVLMHSCSSLMCLYHILGWRLAFSYPPTCPFTGLLLPKSFAFLNCLCALYRPHPPKLLLLLMGKLFVGSAGAGAC